MIIPEDEYEQPGVIKHYGTPHHSGRYPWGSGENPRSENANTALVESADALKKQGLSETEIASRLKVTTTQLRDIRTLVRNERKQDEIHMARKLKDKMLSNGAIAARMREAGFKVSGESQVRALLNPNQERRSKILDNVTNTLRDAVDKKGYVDVGSGVEFQLNITSTKLRSALQKLQDEGYMVLSDVKVEQQGTGNFTNMKVLAKPGTTWGDAVKHRHEIQQINEFSNDGGQTILNIAKPMSFSSKRLGVRYDEDGGSDADGVIFVRRGVDDVTLGGSRYAQVRIAVDGTHYIKGMAVYKDDMPDGVDLQFNTNKRNTGNKLDALKPMKRLMAPGDDPSKPEKYTGPIDHDNPFGATIDRQIGHKDPHNDRRVVKPTSVMNIVNDEGKWDKWSKSLSSQMLSKQRPALAKEQLDLTYLNKKSELESIMALTNPSVRKKLLDAYADGTDSAAVHLRAAHMPRQKTQVILPISDIKPTEVYAPNFDTGDHVALIRFPHGGTFEIPELVVNNNNPAGKKLLGPNAIDAIGIHPKVAERLSGADFDGDNVLVIPNNSGKIKSTPGLKGLEGFDPKDKYPPYEGMKPMTARDKGMQMGLVSNLITDMTLRGATEDELARAVRHSMVVIDAEKHKLDYRRSAQDNGIPALMKKYQSSSQGGAYTLISKARSPLKVDERKPRSARDGGPIDPETGKKVYQLTGRARKWTDSEGKEHVFVAKTNTVKLAETDDAHTLSSGTVMEKFYADHSNRLKSLANQARKELVTIKPRRVVPSAKIAFATEVKDLNSKIDTALRNAPLERQAQVFAGATVKAKIQANPSLLDKENKAELKKIKSQALAAARIRTGAVKQKFLVTDNEWKAIENGAITAHKLDQILTYADLERIRELATPRDKVVLPPARLAKAKSLHAQGYTWAEVAASLGVSVSTIKDAIIVREEGD